MMQQHIVFVGAGGAGVSSLVHLFCELGLPNIIAIDSTESELTKKLTHAGVEVIIGHGKYTVQQDDIIIYSDAAATSPEVQAAEKKMLNNRKKIFPPLTYFQCLGEISKYMTTISIAGTHGKSTTTGLCASILQKHHEHFGLAIVGAPINQRGHRNFILGTDAKVSVRNILEHILFPKGPEIAKNMKKLFFVVEADEYNHHFLHLDTDYACITNIELDHADVYGSFENYMQTFLDFANHVRHDIFIGEHCLGYTSFIEQSTHTKIHSAPQKQFTFETLLGAHNHANASLALACAQYLCPEVDSTTLQEDLATFKGLRRRGEYIGKNIFNVPIISDYAHHPSELASTLTAVQESYADQEITLIFQPHQARRVVEFWDAFISACTGATHTHIYTIYTARETLEGAKTYTMGSEEVRNIMKRIHSFDELGEALANKVDGIYHTSFDEIATLIAKTTSGVILICTAGDLDWQVRKLVQEST